MKSKIKLLTGVVFLMAGIQAAIAFDISDPPPGDCFKCSDASGGWKCEKIKCPSDLPPPV
ncbi:hypothetical protein [Aliikangiella sp. IMCC44359]|uniref:hypothetical protein n=1 Tax=Aliikangiella sp. IMCC44359 TaxID=3459125 RepID=UPI00403AA79E